MMIDVSEGTLGDSKYATTRGNRPTKVGAPVIQTKGKKQLCKQKNVLWNLLYDVHIEGVKLRKG